MLCLVQLVAFLQLDTMKSETSLLHFSQRFAIVSILNRTCSHSLVRQCRSALHDNSRLDIAACGFWGSRFERAFFDVRVFNPCARSNRQASLLATYRRHEQEKKRQYDRRIREVEHSTFTPLVLSTTVRMGRAATTFYKRLAAMLSEKRDVALQQNHWMDTLPHELQSVESLSHVH